MGDAFNLLKGVINSGKHQSKSKRRKCPNCNRNGTVFGINAKPINCCTCNGTGKVK